MIMKASLGIEIGIEIRLCVEEFLKLLALPYFLETGITQHSSSSAGLS
jgi:hypothetical protein